MLALLLLAVAVGLSNLAASIGIGIVGVNGSIRMRIAVVFGLFEAGMPVLGLVLGHGLAAGLGQAARWLGGGVLIALGTVSMVHAWRTRVLDDAAGVAGGGAAAGGAAGGGAAGGGAAGGGAAGGGAAGGGEPARPWRTGRVVVSALALSGDNLAAGFALGAYHTGLAVAATVIGAVSVAMSLAGLELGARVGVAAGNRSELIASAMLIAVGAVIATGAF
jgi:manganese efflux pump family protein